MPRKAPNPLVRVHSNTQDTDGEKKLHDNLYKAHMMAARNFLSSLNLNNSEKKIMKNLLIEHQRERKET